MILSFPRPAKKRYVVRMILSEDGNEKILSYRRLTLDLTDVEAFYYALVNIKGPELVKDAGDHAKPD